MGRLGPYSRTALSGAAGCAAAVGFHQGILFVEKYAWGWLPGASPAEFWIRSLPVLLFASLAGGFLLFAFAPEAAGSGIPQLKFAFWKDFARIPIRPVLVKFIAGAITIGGGLSLGREGPTVFLAGGLAAWFAAKTGASDAEKRAACACGAAAGLAAAFNAPLAAVAFVLEEMLDDLNSRLLGRVLLASLVSVCLLYFAVGPHAAFHIPSISKFDMTAVLLVLPAAAAASFAGVLFQKLTLDLGAVSVRKIPIPAWLKPALGGLAMWIIAGTIFAATGHSGVLGMGYADLSSILNQEIGWQVILGLFAAKLLATSASYASGNCGGIFAPSLFIGAAAGALCAALPQTLGWIGPEGGTLLAVAGMSACLGAVVRAPVTSILIVFEMTRDFAFVPPLMLAALVSQGISRWLCKDSFYDSVLRLGGCEISAHKPPRNLREWKKQPLARLANFSPRCAENLEPKQIASLLASAPFSAFPVTANKPGHGVVSRSELEVALRDNRPPKIFPASTVRADAPLGEAEKLLVDAPLNLLVVVSESGEAIGILTLHDLLRASIALQESLSG